MGTPVKLSDDLIQDAREEAEAADRSLASQIEHWVRLGRALEQLLRHEDGGRRTDLATTLREGRVVYQDAGDGRVERIDRDGTRTVGRFVNRRFTPDEPPRAGREK